MFKIKALVINYPNNPLGAIATKEYLTKVVEFCKNITSFLYLIQLIQKCILKMS